LRIVENVWAFAANAAALSAADALKRADGEINKTLKEAGIK